MAERCEWDPVNNRAARGDDQCPNQSAWSLGSNGTWHVCDSCSKLPNFTRFRKRVAINRNDERNRDDK